MFHPLSQITPLVNSVNSYSIYIYRTEEITPVVNGVKYYSIYHQLSQIAP